MKDEVSLLDVFSDRPHRFRLLDKGINLISLNKNNNHEENVLEIGCAYGDGSAYVAEEHDCIVTGIDISNEIIDDAVTRHNKTISKGVLKFEVENAEQLTYDDNSFDLLISEAAFSPIKDKKAAATEYYRVLKKEGFLLINDFAINVPVSFDKRQEVSYIPCFSGVETMDRYTELFENCGFNTISLKEEYGELVGLSVWLSRVYGVDVTKIGGYLSKYYNYGSNGLPCSGKGRFFNEAKLTYCQMIFKK